jgi:hypothetical protein
MKRIDLPPVRIMCATNSAALNGRSCPARRIPTRAGARVPYELDTGLWLVPTQMTRGSRIPIVVVDST